MRTVGRGGHTGEREEVGERRAVARSELHTKRDETRRMEERSNSYCTRANDRVPHEFALASAHATSPTLAKERTPVVGRAEEVLVEVEVSSNTIHLCIVSSNIQYSTLAFQAHTCPKTPRTATELLPWSAAVRLEYAELYATMWTCAQAIR